jgi:hypothetical protein
MLPARWLIRTLGAPLAFLASGLMMSAAGWMIAISPLGVYVAAGCGFVWGLLLLPLFVVRRTTMLPMAVRVLLPVSIFVASGFFLLRPFLPDPSETTVTVLVIEQTPQGKPLRDLDWTEFGGMPRFDRQPGGFFAPVSLSTFSMSDKRRSRVLVMLSNDDGSENVLSVPRTGDAIYSQQNHDWIAVLKPARKASFGIEVTRKFGVVPDGECCHSSSTQNWVFPPKP